MVEVIMAIEDEYSIDIPDQDMTDIKTIENITDYIEKQLKENSE